MNICLHTLEKKHNLLSGVIDGSNDIHSTSYLPVIKTSLVTSSPLECPLKKDHMVVDHFIVETKRTLEN